MCKKATFMIGILMLMLFSSLCVSAQDETSDKIIAHFFYGEGCPHCADEEPVLEALSEKYPQLEIKYYETWHDTENARLFTELSEACGSKVKGVPTLFIDEEVIIGFTEDITPRQIEDKIIQCMLEPCIDPMERMECTDSTHLHTITQNDSLIELPLFGVVDTSKISLPAFTFIIGLLDGFNPCAMWVLIFLLGLILYAKSRKKILLIGGIFVFTSGFIYFLFMTAWLNFFLIVGYVEVMRIIIALIAIIFGAINIKEFFFFKKGISLTIPEKYKPKLFSKMRALVREEQTTSLIAGTIILAIFANLIELLCTAGFPAIYTRILTLQNMSTFSYYSYLVLYNIFYVIPLAVIVAAFAYTMGAYKFTDRQAKILKIIGGTLMLLLGLVMILKPGLLSFG